jgi:hypothetical protein
VADLPFAITARLADRGQVVFTVVVEDRSITSEKFTPGDGDRRRNVAALWCKDDRLWGGREPCVEGVLAELERLEFEAISTVEALEAKADVPDNHIVGGGYADRGIGAELAWNRETASADFIVYERSTSQLSRAESVDTAAGVLTIPGATSGIVTPGAPIDGAILVPTECNVEHADEATLRHDIEVFVSRYVELPFDSLCVAISYIMLTWTHDSFDELPYLAFRTTDYGRGKSRALDCIGSICHRPMFVGGGSSSAATLRLLDMFGGTLVADEFDHAHNTELASDLNRVLNQGFQRGRPLIKCDGERNEPRAFNCFGPKIFALRKGLGDDATESRTISIRMQRRTRRDIPLNLPRLQFDAEAAALRNRLLAWRFLNYGRARINPALADAELEDRLNQIGLPLLAVAPDEATRQRIVDALHEQQGTITAAASDSLAGELFTVILDTVDESGIVRPRELAKEVNRRRAHSEGIEIERMPAKRSVTAHLAAKIVREEMEMERLPRDRDGARYLLSEARAEDLRQRYGVTPQATAPTSQQHTNPVSSREKPQLRPENSDCDVGDDGAVTRAGVPFGDNGRDERGESDRESMEL